LGDLYDPIEVLHQNQLERMRVNGLDCPNSSQSAPQKRVEFTRAGIGEAAGDRVAGDGPWGYGETKDADNRSALPLSYDRHISLRIVCSKKPGPTGSKTHVEWQGTLVDFSRNLTDPGAGSNTNQIESELNRAIWV